MALFNMNKKEKENELRVNLSEDKTMVLLGIFNKDKQIGVVELNQERVLALMAALDDYSIRMVPVEEKIKESDITII